MADMNALYDLLESSTLYSGQNKLFSYSKSNPVEARVVEEYWRHGGLKPNVITKFGQFLIYTGDLLREAPTPGPSDRTYGQGTYGSGTYGGN